MGKFSLCIELPTWNESKNVKYMIENIRNQCKYQVIVSDQNSTDGTAEIAKSIRAKVFPRKKFGYGVGIKESLENAKKLGHTHLLVMDCDRTYPIDHIEKCAAAAREGYDLVNAARRMSDIRPLNRFPNIFHTILTRLLYGGKISDVNSGMKLMSIEKFLGKITADGNDSTVQIAIIALKSRYKIRNIEVPYNDRHGDISRGRSKIRYRDGIIITWRIIRERFSK